MKLIDWLFNPVFYVFIFGVFTVPWSQSFFFIFFYAWERTSLEAAFFMASPKKKSRKTFVSRVFCSHSDWICKQNSSLSVVVVPSCLSGILVQILILMYCLITVFALLFAQGIFWKCWRGIYNVWSSWSNPMSLFTSTNSWLVWKSVTESRTVWL